MVSSIAIYSSWAVWQFIFRYRFVYFSLDTAVFDLVFNLVFLPGSDDYEGVLHIPQSSSITGALPLDCLTSYPGHLLCVWGVSLTPLQRCCQCIL